MKMPLRHLLQITVSLVLVFTLTACGTTRKVLNLETTAEFKLVASQDVNPTTAGRAALAPSPRAPCAQYVRRGGRRRGVLRCSARAAASA